MDLKLKAYTYKQGFDHCSSTNQQLMGSSPFNFAVTISTYAQMDANGVPNPSPTTIPERFETLGKSSKIPKSPKPEFVGHFEGSIQLQSPPFGGVPSAVWSLYW